MATTHKTHIVRTLACGCQETRWVFGKEITKPQSGCPAHGMFAPRPPLQSWAYTCPGKRAE